MSAYINREIIVSDTTPVIVPFNRWGDTEYSVNVKAGLWKVEGTLDQINRGDVPIWNTLSGISDPGGTTGPLSSIGSGFYTITDKPIEALRVTAEAGGGTIRVVQQGNTDQA